MADTPSFFIYRIEPVTEKKKKEFAESIMIQ
jgi:hypothetical protein